MKIVCLVDNSPGGRYTANSLNSAHGLALAVVESAKRNLFLADLRRFGLRETAHRTRLVLRRLIPRGDDARILNKFLEDRWREFDPAFPTLRTADVNSAEVRREIEKIEPDIVVCHGTMLVRATTIKGVKYSLNVHHGLSPWYRGSRCVEWAIATGDLLNVGVTVHGLTESIDGGPIYGQARVDIEPEDSVRSIGNKMVRAGVEIVSGVISEIMNGVERPPVHQMTDQGAMFWRRQYSRFITMHVEALLRRGELARMIKSPSAQPKPLVAPWPKNSARDEPA